MLDALRDPAVAATSQRFFTTGPGEYGEGVVLFALLADYGNPVS